MGRTNQCFSRAAEGLCEALSGAEVVLFYRRDSAAEPATYCTPTQYLRYRDRQLSGDKDQSLPGTFQPVAAVPYFPEHRPATRDSRDVSPGGDKDSTTNRTGNGSLRGSHRGLENRNPQYTTELNAA